MTWTSKIVSKTYQKGTLEVGIEFTDGKEVFSEPFNQTGGSMDSLTGNVQIRLDTLNQTEKFAQEIQAAVDAKQPIEAAEAQKPI